MEKHHSSKIGDRHLEVKDPPSKAQLFRTK
jgi:hypothetical protein